MTSIICPPLILPINPTVKYDPTFLSFSLPVDSRSIMNTSVPQRDRTLPTEAKTIKHDQHFLSLAFSAVMYCSFPLPRMVIICATKSTLFGFQILPIRFSKLIMNRENHSDLHLSTTIRFYFPPFSTSTSGRLFPDAKALIWLPKADLSLRIPPN